MEILILLKNLFCCSKHIKISILNEQTSCENITVNQDQSISIDNQKKRKQSVISKGPILINVSQLDTEKILCFQQNNDMDSRSIFFDQILKPG
jgi:hypothetical protein